MKSYWLTTFNLSRLATNLPISYTAIHSLQLFFSFALFVHFVHFMFSLVNQWLSFLHFSYYAVTLLRKLKCSCLVYFAVLLYHIIFTFIAHFIFLGWIFIISTFTSLFLSKLMMNWLVPAYFMNLGS